MFSNGTDYEAFLEQNCYRCPLYVHLEQATDKKLVCEIEERIALASVGLTEIFPHEWLDKNDSMPTYYCRKIRGKKRRFKTVDKHSQKSNPLDEQQVSELVELLSAD